MTPKYTKYIFPLLLILLFAGTASALSPTSHDTLRGEMYVSSTANWDSHYSTNNFDVPNGTVVFARYYVGVWAGQSTHDTITTTFNGHSFPTNPPYYSTEMGVTWIPYDVADYVLPGETNIATVNSDSWGDGRQYGSTLVVVLKNETKPQIEYWVAEGCDWMHYDGYLGYDASNSTTYFNGTIDLADVQNASLYSTHLTGFNYEDLNGNSLPSASESVGGEYFNYIRWDNVQESLAPENQTILVSRGSDNYCSVVFHGLSIEYKAADLIPVSLTPTTVVPNTSNTMIATIENRGSKNSQPFNVSLIANDNVVDTQPAAELVVGGNTTIDFHWTPEGSTDAYSLTVVADPENKVIESNKNNNLLDVLIGTTSASSPVADFSVDKTSGDSPFTVTFTDQSTNAPTFWAWDFNNDGTVDSTEQSPSYTYTSAGTYTVNLTVANAGGSDSETKTGYIIVNPLVADFIASPTSGDTPLTVAFTDQSTGTPTSWIWDFGDGTTSTSQNSTHTYNNPGSYTVKLTTTNAGGTNSTVKTDYIKVLLAVGPVWTAKSEWNTYIGSYTVPCFADLDGDGDFDLLFGDKSGISYAYENRGTKNNPEWVAKPEWNAPDVGTVNDYAAPCFADLDDDGDYDLLIGVKSGVSYGYENIGTKNNPVWKAKSEWNVPDVGYYAAPYLADLDGDGDYDLMVGEYYGILYAYENTGTNSIPVWTAKSEWNAPNVGFNVKPALADLDGDGDYDLLIGEYGSGVTYSYENIGTNSIPVWTAKSSWNAPDVGFNAKPALADLDGDGDYDLLIGEAYGVAYAYENTAPLASNPDLNPTSVTPSSSIIVNTLCTISTTINNTGSEDTDAFNTTLSVNDTVVDTQAVSGIASGSNSTVNFTWTPESAGDYNLTVTADPENRIAESDETNNALSITVTSSAAPIGPDTINPVIDSAVLFPANTTAGSTISISVNATDDIGVTEVTAGEIQLTKTDGIWQGSITAPSSVGNYSLSINATDAAGNTAETSVPYSVVKLSGGANIAVSPRSSSVAAGNTVALNLKVKNTQNIDDTFKVRISVSELPASYQANLSWFNWTEKVVTLRAGEEILIPVKVTVPEGTAAGRKLFRANVNSETSSITGFDTGYLTIS